MATQTFPDSVSLVNTIARLEADNARKADAIRLMEIRFADMAAGRYYVASDDGEIAGPYPSNAEAVSFGRVLASEGIGSRVLYTGERIEAEEESGYGVAPGVDYPATLALAFGM